MLKVALLIVVWGDVVAVVAALAFVFAAKFVVGDCVDRRDVVAFYSGNIVDAA